MPRASQSVTLTNTGTATLIITSITVTRTDASQFDFANTCGTTLAVGDSCSIHGHFAPTATGPLTSDVWKTFPQASIPGEPVEDMKLTPQAVPSLTVITDPQMRWTAGTLIWVGQSHPGGATLGLT